MTKVIDEMKYYQLELINREQNYNTMFSSSPQVGVLDPLSKAKGTSSAIILGSAWSQYPISLFIISLHSITDENLYQGHFFVRYNLDSQSLSEG